MSSASNSGFASRMTQRWPSGESLSAEEIIEHCRERIGGYKIPRQMAFLEALPKSAMGKILKNELRRVYSDPDKRRLPNP